MSQDIQTEQMKKENVLMKYRVKMIFTFLNLYL